MIFFDDFFVFIHEYVNDEEFRSVIRMVTALSFVPVDDVLHAFDELSGFAMDEAQVILDYLETNYIGELRRGRRLPPRFPHEMWNSNVRVQENLPRTNNDLEGWHNRFSGFFSGKH